MKYLSLFSGIGGFELGLQNSQYDFECIGFSEINDYAKAIYTRHFPRHKDLGDASKIDPNELQDFDLLVGGFPCQAFSISGYRRGFEDCRGTLFFEIARICEAKRPKYLLLENVKGLLSHDGGRTYKKMLGILSELGYDVEWEVLNSKDFGTAQNRERLYIKGYNRRKCGGEILSVRRDKKQTFAQGLKPITFNRQVKKRVHECDQNELCLFLRKHKSDRGLSISDIAETLDKPISEVEHWFRQDKYFAPPSAEVWQPLKELLGITDGKYDAFITEFEWVDGVYEKDKRAYDSEGLAPTITTNGGSLISKREIKVAMNLSRTGHCGDDVFDVDGLSRTLTASNYKHPLRVNVGDEEVIIRKLTPLECEKLQAFPIDWTKYGADGEPISDTQRYKCLGNAVTTTVVTYIANTMFGDND